MRKEETTKARQGKRGSGELQIGDIPVVLYRCLSAWKGSR